MRDSMQNLKHFSCEFEASSYEDAKEAVRKWSEGGILPPGRYGIGRVQDEFHTNRYYASLLSMN